MNFYCPMGFWSLKRALFAFQVELLLRFVLFAQLNVLKSVKMIGYVLPSLLFRPLPTETLGNPTKVREKV